MLRHLLLVPALLVVSSTSDAGSCFVDHVMTGPPATHTKRCKLSVLEFDGQASLADTGIAVLPAISRGMTAASSR